MSRKLIVITAPSGAGKTSIARDLLRRKRKLKFSISATTRAQRANEVDGKDYYFISRSEFEKKISKGEFVEYEEVYNGAFYGTLHAEVERLWKEGNDVLFDVDVKGASALKSMFGDRALTIFIRPPDIETLGKRLEARGSETPESLKRRLTKAAQEMLFMDKFEVTVLNDELERAKRLTRAIVRGFLKN